MRTPLSARGRRSPDHAEKHSSGAVTERMSNKEGGSHMEAFYKTRYCRYFTTQGSCWKGDDCQFAHSESELRSPPDLTKTRMCAMFRLGYCKLSASECTFAHSLEDLKATDNFYKTEICSFWANGFCRAGEACRHAHGDAELRPRPQLSEMKTRKISEFKKEREAAAAAAADSKAESSTVNEAVSNEQGSRRLSSSSSSHSGHAEARCFDLKLSSMATVATEDSTRRKNVKWVSSTSSDDSWSRQNPTPVTTARSECSASPETSSTVSSYLGTLSTEEAKAQPTFYCVPPLFFPWPGFVPTSPRRLVGIPVDNAATNENLHQEGFCLGVPSMSPTHVAIGLPSDSSYVPSSAVIERWVYC
eukprot:Blabericola_migrator_1__13485@NODE_979_length_5828_cov_333_512064_g678_i0_p2_GENE_NODE_979_length_5828_cov_333_512064_g678_i0NODE_979_length_5828_cov_333_512064_g678_i0_p2_ORF_typecomplete_len386_score61_16zfCCCH/PF00642_24/3_5e07zfCCCH/PF00642_24/0_00099zfCCCH/PF00642_24/7e08zfCCCH_3/PF15663_5/3_2e08zfCCCH_3/PF15663_5/1_6e05Torus/PF16131_5/0_027Torus/PF16131_5/0_46Torus/PF16131_5/0_0019Torus/PF16131_5/1_5e03zf_CCCH_4/PF18345_1/0_00027zf_CCCH_4/PF18345_1/4_3e03zf_CCCH_4/PF18345_1/4_3e02zf_CCCH_4